MAIVKCPNCSSEFENVGKWSTKKFCSRKCSNSRGPRTEIFKRQVSKKLTGRKAPTSVARQSIGKRSAETKYIKLVTVDFNSLSIDSKKKRVIIEQNDRCLHCGIQNWQEKPIKLQVDHIDGHSNNNVRSNLRGLCPNCHSQTETYCGKNRMHKIGGYNVTDARLLTALLSYPSISAALVSLGKGCNAYNYNRCTELLNKHNATFLRL